MGGLWGTGACPCLRSSGTGTGDAGASPQLAAALLDGLFEHPPGEDVRRENRLVALVALVCLVCLVYLVEPY